jgi:hypothetical protein
VVEAAVLRHASHQAMVLLEQPILVVEAVVQGNDGNGFESKGGAGGSGVVVIKIPNTKSAAFTGGVTANGNTGGSITPDTSVAGYNIYVVTATSNTSQTVTFS